MGFTNDFSYSHSTWHTWESCRRKWWLKKVAMWNGWLRNAPAQSRHAYRTKQMANVWMLAGRVVHEIARQIICDGIDRQTADTRYDSRMRTAWREAEAEARLLFSRDPKRKTNLFELFYQGHGINDLRRYAKLAFDRGKDALGRVFDSQPYADIAAGAEIVSAEELKQIYVGGAETGAPVWVVRDLVCRHGGLLWIWDWKTGNRNAGDRAQPLLYALAAVELGEAKSLSEVRLGLAYLKTGEADIFQPKPEDSSDLVDRIVRRAATIRSKLDDPLIQEAPAERFARTDDLDICRRCRMFLACKGHRDLSRPEHVAPGYE